jgi:hypothetical protein
MRGPATPGAQSTEFEIVLTEGETGLMQSPPTSPIVPNSTAEASNPALGNPPPTVSTGTRTAMTGLASSKKFLVIAVVIAIAVASHLARLAGVDINQDALFKDIILPLLTYVGAQGMADFGKERKTS